MVAVAVAKFFLLPGSRLQHTQKRLAPLVAFVFVVLFNSFSFAATLPEERADAMYHRYEGGGMVIDGPSVLVRKNFNDKVSVSGNYYVDTVSSASIDVKTQGASRYTEERTEYSLDTAYLVDKTQFNIGFTKSDENDYEATSARFDISHAFFSEMTTVSIGYSQGDDDISSSRDDTFDRSLKRRNYRVSGSQILTKNLVLNLNYEGIVDEGYLQNPYRKIITINCTTFALDLDSCPLANREAALADEVYPSTRNSDAFSVKLAYHLPWEAALKTKLGYFSDSWGIDSASLEFDYSHRLKDKWIADLRVRFYTQSQAEFYANEFYISGATLPEFTGRDKELSEHSSYSLGLGASYHMEIDGWITDLLFNTQIDYLYFDYDNFREYSTAINAGTDILAAPSYSFDAYALRLFVTGRF